MPLGDPATAPPRADLGFLTHRAKRRSPALAAATRSAVAEPIDYTHHRTAKRAPAVAPAPSTPPTSPSATSTPTRPKIDFTRPDRRTAASPVPAAPAPGPASTSSLDLSGGSAAPAAAPAGVDVRRTSGSTGSGSLDLSSGGPPEGPADPAATAPAAVPTAASAAPRGGLPSLPVHRDARVSGREQYLLARATPTVTLTRVQSGVGHLRVEAVCSDEIGDLRLGALYQFRSGGTSAVQHAGGNRYAPSSRRPVIVASREEYEELAVDLRQIRDIDRFSVYAVSESRTPLRWGGTLIITTFGGARIELPLETLEPSAVGVLVSFYNLAGELVVRTEMESIAGDVREAARAYGYDRITWRDDRSPVD